MATSRAATYARRGSSWITARITALESRRDKNETSGINYSLPRGSTSHMSQETVFEELGFLYDAQDILSGSHVSRTLVDMRS